MRPQLLHAEQNKAAEQVEELFVTDWGGPMTRQRVTELINEYANDGHFRQEWLDALPALHESAHIRHVRCPQPLTILMDGVHRKGVVIC